MKIINVLISAPSDQNSYVDIVINEIMDFNELMKKRGFVFQPTHWTKDISTGRGNTAQDLINSQISNTDMIFVLMGARIGTATESADSGTAEELFNFLENNVENINPYDTHVFFNSSYKENVLDIDPNQLKRVQNFKSEVAKKGVLFAAFSDNKVLEKLTRRALDAYYFASDKTISVALKEKETDEFDDYGLDEYLDLSTQNLAKANEYVSEVATSFTKFSSEMESIQSSTETPKLVIKLGSTAMDKMSEELEVISPNLVNELAKSYVNFNSASQIMIEDFDLKAPEDENEVEDFIVSFEAMIKSAENGASELETLEKTVMRIPRRNREINRSKRRLLNSISTIKESILDFSANMQTSINNLKTVTQ